MDNTPLYQQIAEAIRREISSGKLNAGDRLPSIRKLMEEWGCTPGTIQRAYHILAEQGLIISRPGQGTHVTQGPLKGEDTPLRRANLVHRAQAFLLEALTTGYSTNEIEIAMRLALDQWRTISSEALPQVQGKLRLAGSHDLALAWIAAHFSEIVPGYTLELNISGSLGGLIALAEGKADLAGCHLWDQESDSYNAPFVRRILPGKRVGLLNLAWRQQGLITAAGNPLELRSVSDLDRPGLRFVNRQPGSGTRVWMDAALHGAGISSERIEGYNDERQTHSEVARAVAEGKADVGLGLQTAARAFGLGFIPLLSERYDLVIPEDGAHSQEMGRLVEWLQSQAARNAITELGGYDTRETGSLNWVGE